MINNIKIYLVTLAVFFSIDIVWLAVIAKDLYRKEIGFIMKKNPDWTAAILFYLIFIFGLVYFVINPAMEKDSLTMALFTGMLFGFITYATYDLTNLATLENWPLKITIIDLIWGTVLGGSVSAISFSVMKFLLK